jgi:1-aminocyclopropane-1-carboxylate deaminase/D-cysteine desulfhydrase-like pyridoxal-dependent ACC family enzyme
MRRLVVPVGSGMSLAGILWGLDQRNWRLPVLGVCVGANPEARLERYAPYVWPLRVHLVYSALGYHQRPARTALEGVELDPVYEAKCVAYLRPGDCLWVVGIRPPQVP